MDKNKCKYDKWMLADEELNKKIKKAFYFKSQWQLFAYILFEVIIAACIVYHLTCQELNFVYIIFFLLIFFATMAGIGTQVRISRQMRDRIYEYRDGYVKEINYANNMKRGISSYTVEVNDRNVIKNIVITKSYKKFRPKVDDHVVIVRLERTSSIYFYERLD